MAASAMTPKLLGCISNEKYQEEDKWTIDDIRLGPANELLISGHNLEKPTTFISLYKEDDGKYDNCPEFNQNFRQPQPGEQLALFLEGSSTIGLKVENELRIFSIENKDVLKTLMLQRSPKCVCFYRGKLYAASSSPTSVSVCNLDSEDKSNIILSDMRRDRVLEIVVVMEKIYVCTKNAGQALVFSMTGSKEMEFKHATQSDAKATSICIHERTEHVFVSWSNFQIQLYSQKTSECLRAFDMKEKLHKIRVTSEHTLVTLNSSKCIVTVYDVGEAIKFGESQNTILSSVKKNNQKKLMLHDEENLECHPAHSGTNRKSASKQSKVEKLPDTKELHMEQLEENEIIRRQYDRDVQKLKGSKKLQEGMRKKSKSQQNIDYLDQEKGQGVCEERPRVQVLKHATNLKKVQERNAKLEDKVTELNESFLTKENIAKEVQTFSPTLNERVEELEGKRTKPQSRKKNLEYSLIKEKEKIPCKERPQFKLNEKINRRKEDLEDTRTKPKRQQRNLKFSLVNEPEKVPPGERSQIKVQERVGTIEETANSKLSEKTKELEGKIKELESQQEKLKDNLEEEKQKVTREERSRAQAENALETSEKTKLVLEKEIEEKDRRMLEELRKVEEQKNFLFSMFRQAETSRKSLEKKKTMIEKEKEDLTKQLSAEQGKGKDMKESLLQAKTSIEKLTKAKVMLQKEKEELNKQLSAEKRRKESPKAALSKNLITSLHQVRSVINDNLDNISEYSPEVNQPDPEQRKQNNDNQERRRNSRRTRERRSALTPMIPKRQSREKMGTPVEKMQQEEIGYTTDSTTDNESSSGYETPSEFEWGRALSPGSVEKMQQEEFGYTTDSATDNESTSGYETASEFVRERALSPGSVEKMQQEEFGYTTDSTTDNESTSGYETPSEFEWRRTLSPGSAAKIQHDAPGITTHPATDHEEHRSYVSDDTCDTDTVKGDSDEEEVLDGQSKLEVCARVSVEGANLKIAETGVSLFIPPGALSEEQTIHMKIIPQPCDAQAALKFECNSVVVVELLPNHCRFQRPVSLTLPHCLQLKEEYERNSVDVLISHHEEGFKPKWEILHDAKFYLWKENCTISLHSFCWVTYEIHDTIVEAKRIKLYTAGKRIRLNDRIAEVEVGFYPDLPGSGKILELNKDMHLSQRKPYVFLKTGEEPLLINLHKIVPKEWNNSQPDENPKIIPFDSVSISEERSCPFVLERSGDDTDIPLCIFKVGQKGRNEVELTIRPDVLTAESYYAEKVSL